MQSYDDAQDRIPNQIEKMINLLKESGEKGVTNNQLSKICLGYGTRISELYQKGYEIEVTSKGRGVYKYVLKKSPTSELKFYENAKEEIIRTIKQDFNDRISGNELRLLLNKKDFNIRRNQNWFKKNTNIN